MTDSIFEELLAKARAEWREAVGDDDTRLGFVDWCRHQASYDDPTLKRSTLTDVELQSVAAYVPRPSETAPHMEVIREAAEMLQGSPSPEAIETVRAMLHSVITPAVAAW